MLNSPGRSLMTMERGRDPSGHIVWDSAHTIASPRLVGAVGREGSAFFECSDFNTRFGCRGSGNHPLNTSARIVACCRLLPVRNPSTYLRLAPLAFGTARLFLPNTRSPFPTN